MRAARLLHTLLLLQNRGRMTSARLAAELEVSRRTVLRDLDAMTEAGLPVIVHRGRDGRVVTPSAAPTGATAARRSASSTRRRTPAAVARASGILC